MTVRADGTPIEVLLVEDDPGDVLMTQEAFEEHKVRNRLTVLQDRLMEHVLLDRVLLRPMIHLGQRMGSRRPHIARRRARGPDGLRAR